MFTEYDELADLFSARDQISELICSEETKTLLRSALQKKINELMIKTVKKFDLDNVFDKPKPGGNGNIDHCKEVAAIKTETEQDVIEIRDLSKSERLQIVRDKREEFPELSYDDFAAKFDMSTSVIYKLLNEEYSKSEMVEETSPDIPDDFQSEIYDLLKEEGEMDVGGLVCHTSLDVQDIKGELSQLTNFGLVDFKEPEPEYLVYFVRSD